ncbi:hypothetical protein [Oceanobacillus sp. Castelsardo]|uniref:hypothetical protein n=1 Tax=Oceanobacillus sp. Castelsardo TaxID=1851204 RepID=UPI000837FA43|nr:hypothetical protein [Oceanobacillus sp. Castelsardo]
MENSDQHLKIATDIAYQDLDKVIKKMYYKTGDSPTIEEIITFAERHGQESVVKNIEKKLNLPEHANVKDDILHWRIVEVHNKNGKDDNGFYAN